MRSDQSVDSGVPVAPAFVLLFSIRLKGAFKGFTAPHPFVTVLPADDSRAWLEGLAEFERLLLGKTFLEARRITRWPLGRIMLEGMAGDAPTHADVYLLSHKLGVALWEAWLPAPPQPFDASRLIGWLDPEAEDGLVARLWRVLGDVNLAIAGKNTWSGLYFPLTLIRIRHQALAGFAARHGPDLVRLLFLDRSHRTLKPEVTSSPFCVRSDVESLGFLLHG